EMGADAAASGRMPPVLHVALEELSARGAEEVFTRRPGSGVEEGGGVLQLVAESVGPAGLIVPTAAPITTGESLVLEPAVHEKIQSGVGSLGVDSAEGSFPEIPYVLEGPPCVSGAAMATNEMVGFAGVVPRSDEKDDFFFLSGREIEGDLK